MNRILTLCAAFVLSCMMSAHLSAQRIHLSLLRARHLAHHPHHGIADILHRLADFTLLLLAALAAAFVCGGKLLAYAPAHLRHLLFGAPCPAVQQKKRRKHRQHKHKTQHQQCLLRVNPSQICHEFHHFTLPVSSRSSAREANML